MSYIKLGVKVTARVRERGIFYPQEEIQILKFQSYAVYQNKNEKTVLTLYIFENIFNLVKTAQNCLAIVW